MNLYRGRGDGVPRLFVHLLGALIKMLEEGRRLS